MSDSNVVIRVEGLGKKFSLHHEQSERYTTLRDVVAHQAKAAGRLLNPFTLAGQLRKARRQAAQEHAASEEEFWALKDVNFEIRRGERVGIIGRNGAGKSTLLKILSRITEPTTGRVEIRGRVASLLEVGTGFHPELTGRENIYLNGAILGMTRREIRSKFDEIVDFAEVEKFLDTPVKRYSSGMYVRLAFAVAAHLEPEILVVDEVLAVGDASFQKKCLGKMEDVSRAGRTILFVSHNMPAVNTLCSRGIALQGGRLILDSDIQQAVSSYLGSGSNYSGRIDLQNHPNRERGLKPWLDWIEIDGADQGLELGKAVEIMIGYRAFKPIREAQFTISFATLQGEQIFVLNSSWQSSAIPESLDKRGVVKCVIPKLPLMPGRYSVSTRLWIVGEKLDDIPSFAEIDVSWTYREAYQQPYQRGHGLVYVDAEWAMLTSNSSHSIKLNR
jgi:lipopolysaccharide transport system ATP-binding protein